MWCPAPILVQEFVAVSAAASVVVVVVVVVVSVHHANNINSMTIVWV